MPPRSCASQSLGLPLATGAGHSILHTIRQNVLGAYLLKPHTTKVAQQRGRDDTNILIQIVRYNYIRAKSHITAPAAWYRTYVKQLYFYPVDNAGEVKTQDAALSNVICTNSPLPAVAVHCTPTARSNRNLIVGSWPGCTRSSALATPPTLPC